MTKEQHDAGVAILQTAPKGAAVHLTYAGKLTREGKPNDPEITQFFNQILSLFDCADHWTINGKYFSVPDAGYADGGVAHALGVGCYVKNPAYGEIAKKALAEAGFPCAEDFFRIDSLEKPVDIYISIGTRIIPPQ
jgi:hypothetical protein